MAIKSSFIRIRTKVVVFFLVIASLVSIAVYLYFNTYLIEPMREVYFEKLTTVREVKKRQIEEYFQYIDKKLDTIAITPCVQNVLSSSKTDDDLKLFFQNYITKNKFKNFYIIQDNKLLFTTATNQQELRLIKDSIPKISSILTSSQSVFFDFNSPKNGLHSTQASYAKPIIKDGKVIAILLVALEIEEIDAIMTNDESWIDQGFQNTGEVYLIGSDCLMRNNSRFLVEDSEKYYSQIQSLYGDELVKKVRQYGTTILLQPVEGQICTDIQNNISGIDIVKDYRDIEVLSAYTPVNINGVRWGVLSEVDKEEVDRILLNLQEKIMIIIILVFIFTYLAITLFSKVLLKQLELLKDGFVHLGEGELSYRVKINSNDDFGMLSDSFNEAVEKLEDLDGSVRKLSVMSYTDPLTNLYNRRKCNEILSYEIDRFKRKESDISLVMFDIDHFKRINDTYGHDVGDYALEELSTLLLSQLRSVDIVVRWGGEEFMVILFNTNLDNALKITEKLRKTIEIYKFKHFKSMTCSFGITQMQTGDEVYTVVKRVDDALYEAKNNGRNRIEVL